MSNTLMTEFEVIKFGPVEHDYPTDYISKQLKRVEKRVFKKCWIGLEYYNALLADRTYEDYSEIAVFDDTVTYALDAIVNYGGVIYKSLKASNDVHIDDNDALDPSWEEAKKFNSDENNDIWEECLREWLAIEIIISTMRKSTYKLGAKGATKVIGDETDIATVNSTEFAALKREYRFDADDALEEVYDYMVGETEDGSELYSGISKIAEDCSETTKCYKPKNRKGRRFLFKN